MWIVSVWNFTSHKSHFTCRFTQMVGQNNFVSFKKKVSIETAKIMFHLAQVLEMRSTYTGIPFESIYWSTLRISMYLRNTGRVLVLKCIIGQKNTKKTKTLFDFSPATRGCWCKGLSTPEESERESESAWKDCVDSNQGIQTKNRK